MPTQIYPPIGGYVGTTGYYPPTVWQNWVSVGIAQTQAITITNCTTADPWPLWVGVDVGTTGTQNVMIAGPTTLANTVWVNWNTGYAPPVPATPPVPLTPEEIARQERERMRNALITCNRANARRLRRKQAERRAEILLLENLTDAQREEWAAGQSFHVETADGQRRYRIKLGMAGNVSLVECKGLPPTSKHGRPLRPGNRFCMHVYHPDGWVPDADNVLAQKLLLESEGGEAEFLAHANVS